MTEEHASAGTRYRARVEGRAPAGADGGREPRLDPARNAAEIEGWLRRRLSPPAADGEDVVEVEVRPLGDGGEGAAFAMDFLIEGAPGAHTRVLERAAALFEDGLRWAFGGQSIIETLACSPGARGDEALEREPAGRAKRAEPTPEAKAALSVVGKSGAARRLGVSAQRVDALERRRRQGKDAAFPEPVATDEDTGRSYWLAAEIEAYERGRLPNPGGRPRIRPENSRNSQKGSSEAKPSASKPSASE